MKKEDKKWFKQWEIATQNITNIFTEKYFKGVISDIYWVADEVGGVLTVNDYFFNLSDIIDFIRYDYKVEDMFEYYDYRCKKYLQGKETLNIKSWKELNK